MRLPRVEPRREDLAAQDQDGEHGQERQRSPTDLRMPLLGAAAWIGGLLARHPVGLLLGGCVAFLLAVGGLWAARRGRVDARLVSSTAWTVVGVGLVLAAALTTASLRAGSVAHGPVAELADQGAVVRLEGRVVSDPRVVAGRFGDQVAVRLVLRDVTGRGERHLLAAPVMVLGDLAWSQARLGATVGATGRLVPADDPDLAALVTGASTPVILARPGAAWRGAERLRESIRGAVEHRPPGQAVLVPALVDGDDAGLDPDLEEDFRVTGLTHLTAVSGTNLTLVVGFLLILARWLGVRGRWLTLVGAAGVVGFVLLARTEPSVLRAAVMGSVGLLAMGWDGRDRALRGLGIAVVVLVLAQPALAAAPGFALSVLATAGIVLLGPALRDALVGWLPRVVAEAVAVPMAAQLACTPVVAAISGQVSMVAVAANLLVGPVVGPATVLGLLGGLVGLVSGTLSQGPGTLAAWCVAWIVTVARRGADLPLAAFDWGTGAAALAGLTVLTVAVALVGPWVLRRRLLSCLVVVGLVVAVCSPVPLTGRGWPLGPWSSGDWPPPSWAMVMCDVGQGDAIVLRAGRQQAVVVDAGPDPGLVDGCLDRLGVTAVPMVVLTHFHADHVDGLPGVLEGRQTGTVIATPVLDPPSGVAQVGEDLADADAGSAPTTPVAAPVGTTLRVGEVDLQVLWPGPGVGVSGRTTTGDGSSANDASVVLLARVGGEEGVRVLLTGDVEPPAQERLAAQLGAESGGGLDVDVLKVPHHGSRYQDLVWLTSLGAEQALVSVGEDNDYGHPAGGTLEALTVSGSAVHRTDLEGDLAVVLGAEGATVVGRS